MIYQIYTAITSQLQTITGSSQNEICQIGIYNSQFDYLGDEGENSKVKEYVVTPAVFIEFTPITYNQLGLNVQQTDAFTRLPATRI